MQLDFPMDLTFKNKCNSSVEIITTLLLTLGHIFNRKRGHIGAADVLVSCDVPGQENEVRAMHA